MRSRGSVRTADMDSQMYTELGQLMNEYPDWKEQFPELCAELNPVRYTKNRRNAKKDEPARISRRVGDPSVSDYQATYTPKRSHRPRSSKRPPPSPRDRCPPPMLTRTVQQDEFRPKFDEYEGRPALMKKEDEYEPPRVKFEAQSGYSLDFPVKSLPSAERRRAPVTTKNRTKPSGKFDDRTTNKDTFKTWSADRAHCYTELPSFTGSVLYPDKSRQLETTTATTYKGTLARRPDPIRVTSPNIKIEGDREFGTVNQNTYKHHGQVRPASMIVHKPEIASQSRSKFDSKTMNSTDYAVKSQRPPKPCSPPRPTIDLKFNNKVSFSTEQRQQFPGIDVTTAPAVVNYKPDVGDYRPPSQKFETRTKHQMDYPPLDVMASYQPPAKPPASKQRNLPKFNATTTSQEFFKRWETEPRKQYGDVHEALQFLRSDVFVPSFEKFDTVPTTKETYTGKTTNKPDPFIPEAKGIDRSGVFDFNTMYRTTFDGQRMEKNLSKSQAARLLNELRKRKAVNKISSAPNFGHNSVEVKC